jgi:serine/threonine protein kinase
VLLYRMVTGQVPFDGVGVHPFELCQRHIGEEPAPPRQVAPWLKPAMEAVILKALRKSPSERHQSAMELCGELARVLAELESIEMERTEPYKHQDLALTVSLLTMDLEAPVPLPLPVAIQSVITLPVATLDAAPVIAGLGSLFMALAPLVHP